MSWASNRLEVFVKGCVDALWQKSWTGSGWSPGYGTLGGCLTSGGGARAYGVHIFDVMVRGCDGNLWWNWSAGSGQPWNGYALFAAWP